MFWILWLSFAGGIFVIYHFIAPKASVILPRPDELPWVLGAVPFLFSAIIRWVLLPRAQDASKALPLFIIGIAMAEATMMLGLFLFRSHHRDLFILSVFGVLQFIPLFARRF
ncbi:MAG TPA: hypothetical protein VF614_04860, partial [Chthoniobacteraceae bacterium]